MAELDFIKKQKLENFTKSLLVWQDYFGLNNWKINVQSAIMDEKMPFGEKNRGIRTLADYTYATATMVVYPSTLASPEEWDEMIVHELIHVVMAEYDFLTDNLTNDHGEESVLFMARENTVSQLTKIFARLYTKVEQKP